MIISSKNTSRLCQYLVMMQMILTFVSIGNSNNNGCNTSFSAVGATSAHDDVCASEKEEEECSTTNDDKKDDDGLLQQRRNLLEMKLVQVTVDNDDDCKDNHEKCNSWASIGECDKNPVYMHSTCKKSCDKCSREENAKSIILMHKNSWGEPQQLVKGNDKYYNQILDLLVETQDYMTKQVYIDAEYASVKPYCQNKHKSCTKWASQGECQNNPKYMKTSCAPACQTCDMLDYNKRCPTDDPETLRKKSIWKQPGDLDDMFLQILNNPYIQTTYNPVVHSKPNYVTLQMVEDGSSNQTLVSVSKNISAAKEDDGILSSLMKYYFDSFTRTTTEEEEVAAAVKNNNPMVGVPMIDNGPWVVTLDNFLTDQECDTLIELGYKIGYERSGVVGDRNKHDGSIGMIKNDEGRTSTQAWCNEPSCFQNETVQTILQKMYNLTGIPDENAEYLQLLKYEPNQFYQRHHDYTKHHFGRSYGVRILTLFLYLNNVEEGGETNFPALEKSFWIFEKGLTITPKKGKAVLWPSVWNDQLEQKDPRTDHAALPVVAGQKFGANLWFHSRDFKDAYQRGCI